MVHELVVLKYMLPETNEETGRKNDMLFCFYLFLWILDVWFSEEVGRETMGDRN